MAWAQRMGPEKGLVLSNRPAPRDGPRAAWPGGQREYGMESVRWQEAGQRIEVE
jgi:hypothetical protein